MDLQLVLVTIIAVCALLAFQFGAMYFLISASINPLKKDIANLEAGQANLEAGQANLEAGQAKLSEDIAEIKQLLKKS